MSPWNVQYRLQGRCIALTLDATVQRFSGGRIFEHAWRELLGQHRPQRGRTEHQHEHHIEHPAIDQGLACGVEGMEGDERGREGRRHLRQGQ